MRTRYYQSMGIQPLIEVAIGVYLRAASIYALAVQTYGSVPYLVLFQVGFFYAGGCSILQEARGRRSVVGVGIPHARELDV
jgi:hypothetical protein